MREWNQLRREFTGFMRDNRHVLWISVLAVLLGYGVTLSGLRVGIDMEVNMYDPDKLLDSWYTIRRYSLVWLKDLLGMREFNPTVQNLLMMAVMALCGVTVSFSFSAFSEHRRRMRGFCAVFPALFLTHPCFAQQFVFTMQAFEVAVCMLATATAAFCVGKWSFSRKWGWLAAGVPLMVFGFGGYQALVPFYMALALGLYLIYYEFHVEKPRWFYLQAALLEVLAFVIGYVLYSLLGKLIIVVTQGWWFPDEYLDGQLLWSSNPAETCIGFIKHYMRQVLLGEGEFYSGAYLLLAVVFAVRLLYVWAKRRRRDYILYAMASLCMVLSPFFLSFYQGGAVLMRTQFALPAALAFFGAAAAMAVSGKSEDRGERGQVMRLAGGVLLAALFVFAFRQGSITGRAMLSAQWAHDLDRQAAFELSEAMHRIGAVSPDTRVAMVGCYSPELPASADIRQETIGYSVFEWDYQGEIGVTERGTGFMKAMGVPFEPATKEEYDRAVEMSASMPGWPYEGSVQWMGDVVVVKFPQEEPR